MLKTKQRRFAIVAVLLFSMITMYGGLPEVNAASMESAKVTLGDSDLSAVSTSTVVFQLATDLVATDYIEVDFHADFSTIASANAICPSDATEGGAGDTIRCTVVSTLASTSLLTLTVSGVTNPAVAGDYSISVTSYNVGDTEIETTETKIYIIDDVTVTAHVAASLSFAVAGTTTAAVINGDTTTGSSSPWEMAFGTLDLNTEALMGQILTVSTNASAGYSVTVQQDQDMTSAGGADINAFNTGGPIDWAAPAATLGVDTTYGHMGVASDDSDLGTTFTDGFYQGLTGVTPLEVMSHDGPANGIAVDSGKVQVMYNIEISGLQEAGDYENTLTYVCTPTY